ncbi:hypothetical protein D3C87_509530 [compost metagenome]
MKYTLIKRNKSFRANSDFLFIKWMRKTDLQFWENNQDFMEGYAYRKLMFEKILIRSDNEAVFIEDLQKNKLLKIEQSKPLLNLFRSF